MNHVYCTCAAAACASPDFDVIVPDRSELEILGRVVEVRRSLV